MCEKWSNNDSKLPLGGFLGASGGPLGAMWVPRGAPRLKKSEKVSSWTPPRGSILEPIFGYFRDFMLFGGCFLGVFVFEPFGDSIFTVLGFILDCCFAVFFVVFL